MARNKKRVRINKKKAHRKVVVKRQTPDQKAKENDMMKILLSRPMMGPAPAQQNQQNDKLVEKLEAATRKENELRRQNDNLESALTRRRQDIEVQRDRREDIHNRENLIAENQRREQQQEEYERRRDELQRVQNQYDLNTAEGRARAEIDDIVEETRRLRRELSEAETEQKKNRLFQAIQPLRDERDRLETQKAIVDGVFQSNDWIHAKEAYEEAAKEKYLSEIRLEQSKLIADKKREKMRNDADKEALQLAEEELDAPKPRQIVNKDGSLRVRNGKPVYKKDRTTNEIIYYQEDSERNKFKRELAQVNNELADSKIELAKVKTKNDNTIQQLIDLNNKKIQIANDKADALAIKSYLEGDDYKKKKTSLEEERQKVAKAKARVDIEKAKTEEIKKIRDIEIQSEVASRFISEEADSADVITQIQALGDQGQHIAKNVLSAAEGELDLRRARDELRDTYEHMINQYGKAWKDIVETNLKFLISAKTQDRFNEDIYTNDLHNTRKMTEFIKYIDTFNHELVSDSDMIASFIDSNDFEKFKWD